MKKLIAIMVLFVLSACSSNADIASYNMSKAAEQFEIERRIVFYNGITADYILIIQGRCAIKDQNNQLEVICRTGVSSYKKHFLGLSDNVTYFAEQMEGAGVSVYHYRVIFKPQTIVPDIEFKGSLQELVN